MLPRKRVVDGLRYSIEQAKDKDKVDVTTMLQMLFESADRHIDEATVYEEKMILLKLGLRSSILEPFPRYLDTIPTEHYMLCDILGLVPALALLVSEDERNTLTMGAIETKGI